MRIRRLKGGAGLGGALRAAWLTIHTRPEVVVAGVAGGRGALVPFTPIVTILSGEPDEGPTRADGWLARLQTRRSRLVYAKDRPTAVTFALRWRLDLARIRVTGGVEPSPADVGRDLLAARTTRRSWHSA